MLTIYGIPISVHTRKVIVAAMTKNVPHRIEPVIPFFPPDNWKELSPTGRIPVVTDDSGDVIADSSVICTYLDKTYDGSALYPGETRALTRTLWLEEYCDGTLFPGVIHGLFQQRVINPQIFSTPTDQSAIDRIQADVEPRMFGYIEGQLTGDYLVDGCLSMADIALASNFINYMYLGYCVDEIRFPRLARYLNRLTRMDPFREALQAEAPFADQMGLDRSFLL